jgi:hypothetical protein
VGIGWLGDFGRVESIGMSGKWSLKEEELEERGADIYVVRDKWRVQTLPSL